MKKYFALISLLFFGHFLQGQPQELPKRDTIAWKNPSFEGTPNSAQIPDRWDDCGFQNESPSDIQPGFWGVKSPAKNGKTYVGMVTRDNGTYEAIGQKLSKKLIANKTYSFTLAMYCSDTLISTSSKTKQKANFSNPAYLKVWGAKKANKEAKLLYVSQKPISNRNWEKFEIIFTPTVDCQYIILEAATTKYNIEQLENWYNCNLMIDDLSPIIEVVD
jgi:hypothetical protein